MALTNKLSAIGDAIRSKNGTTALILLDDMPAAIEAIQTGGDSGEYFSDEDLTFNGNCEYLFSYGRWTPVLEKEAKRIKINPTSVRNMFQNCTLEDLSKINIVCTSTSTIYGSSMFSDCYYLEKLPNTTGIIIYANQGSSLFNKCYSLCDENELIKFFTNNRFQCGWPQGNSMFSDCYSLRNINAALQTMQDVYLIKSKNTTNSDAYEYAYMFYNCKALDEIRNIPLSINEGITVTSNKFSQTFNGCMRVKDVIFETDNGEPIVLTMKGQTIDLTANFGYWSYYNTDWKHVTQYKSGITEDKLVTDAASYEALKNDPDWFSTNIEYSRYNHDSAVNTINSLPDTAAYGTNTIKFKGAAGSGTDGGAINTLTEEEIAVAAAKGWTVTLS